MNAMQFTVTLRTTGPDIDAQAMASTIQTAVEQYQLTMGLTMDEDTDCVESITVSVK
jgi:hypothetical protein